MNKIILMVVMLFLVTALGIHAQNALPASGGNIESGSGSVSYSVGQPVYTSTVDSDGSVAQGVQQTYEITVVTGAKITNISLDMMVYPNPTTDFLNLTITDLQDADMQYTLHDSNGRLLQQKKITETEISIDMSEFNSALYFLIVKSGQQVIKKFKILKN